MGRYLIAGAAGYVGARLAGRLLAQGHSVRGLVRDGDTDVVQRLAAQGMAVWEGDVTQPDTLVGVANGVEHVYNLTARFVLEHEHVRRLFVDGNRNLIAACSRARTVRSYVFTGNAAPYGNQGDALLHEDAPVAPCYPLGEAMVAAEQAVLELVRRHAFPAMILRVGTIYGPERDFIGAVESGTALAIGDGRNYQSYIHVDDLLDVLERVALEGQPGAVYNVCDDTPVRAATFYAEIAERLGVPPPRAMNRERAGAAGLDASVIGMASSSTRLSNRRIVEELGLTLRYGSFRVWLDEQVGVLQEAVVR